jgi:hypothetical protein
MTMTYLLDLGLIAHQFVPYRVSDLAARLGLLSDCEPSFVVPGLR